MLTTTPHHPAPAALAPHRAPGEPLTGVASREDHRSLRSLATSPLVWLGLWVAVAALLLCLPLALAIGPNHWDLYVYFDAARRLELGQVPHVDFFAPVGALGYYLFAGGLALFPNAQPLLLVQWCLLAVTAPLMALVVADVDRRSRPLALALVAPFILFSALPFNFVELYPSPGVDGYGIYNRHTCLLLYALVAALVFCEDRRRLTVVVGGALTALFLTKITGFVAGGIIAGYAVAAGRLPLRSALAASAGLGAVALGLELWSGMMSAYLADIRALVLMNQGSLLSRILTLTSVKFDAVGVLALLVAVLLIVARGEVVGRVGAFWSRPSAAGVRALLRLDAAWLAVGLGAAMLFETQNTGSQEFLCLWPILLRIIATPSEAPTSRARLVVLVLVAAAALPPLTRVLHRTARVVAVAPGYQALPGAHLGELGRVSAKPLILDRALVMAEHYAEHRPAYEALAERGQLSSYILYSEPDYQVSWLLNADRAAAALLAYEAANGVRLESLYALDFTDPFPWLLKRRPPRHVPIGLDAFRTFPTPDAEVFRDLAEVDAILVPRCPVTTARRTIEAGFAPAFAGRTVVSLTPCWEMHLRPAAAAASRAP